MSEKRLYGWYSEKQRAYLREYGARMIPANPNISLWCRWDGDHVKVTEVTPSPDGPSGRWGDYEPRGEVVRWIKHIPA